MWNVSSPPLAPMANGCASAIESFGSISRMAPRVDVPGCVVVTSRRSGTLSPFGQGVDLGNCSIFCTVPNSRHLGTFEIESSFSTAVTRSCSVPALGARYTM